MTPIVVTYIVYVLLSLGLTVWVAKTLARNGLPFLIDALKGKEELARSVNHLLVVGFYLINLGYATLALRLGYQVNNTQQIIEALSFKVGLVVVVLGVMHFFNLYILNRLRTRGTSDRPRVPGGPPPPPILSAGPPLPAKE